MIFVISLRGLPSFGAWADSFESEKLFVASLWMTMPQGAAGFVRCAVVEVLPGRLLCAAAVCK